MTGTINIPIKLMKRYRKDKALWELFVFAVCMKCLDGSSALRPTVPLVRRLMGCSYYKAERMIERAKTCGELFRYFPKSNVLIARSFKTGNLEEKEVRLKKKTYTARYAFCYKFRFDVSDDKDCRRVSHIEVSRTLRDKLLVHAIKARQLKNDLPCKQGGDAPTRSTRKAALHSRRLGCIAGYHHSTATRHLRRMEEKGELSVIRHDFVPVIDHRRDVVVTDDVELLRRRPFPRHGFLVVKDCNEYIMAGTNADVFVNVIFNHRRHKAPHFSKKELALGHYGL